MSRLKCMEMSSAFGGEKRRTHALVQSCRHAQGMRRAAGRPLQALAAASGDRCSMAPARSTEPQAANARTPTMANSHTLYAHLHIDAGQVCTGPPPLLPSAAAHRRFCQQRARPRCRRLRRRRRVAVQGTGDGSSAICGGGSGGATGGGGSGGAVGGDGGSLCERVLLQRHARQEAAEALDAGAELRQRLKLVHHDAQVAQDVVEGAVAAAAAAATAAAAAATADRLRGREGGGALHCEGARKCLLHGS
eukprot:TRINITY_DN2388_c0_g1_i1.p1 TRINITY_DN2388_c0_g1~~TRINITY_DN2388_c0_g1_i1.p1  ORF type:complete len:249 (+),score=59.08 TRINITY_DN2388_c0_g1_i1:130-876(+)